MHNNSNDDNKNKPSTEQSEKIAQESDRDKKSFEKIYPMRKAVRQAIFYGLLVFMVVFLITEYAMVKVILPNQNDPTSIIALSCGIVAAVLGYLNILQADV